MRFIDEEEKLFGKIIKKAGRGSARRPFAEMAGIVFDPFAKTNFADHFKIVISPLFDSLGLYKAVFFLEERDPLCKFLSDTSDCVIANTFRGHIVRSWKDRDFIQPFAHFTGDGIDFADSLDLIAEEFYAIGQLVFVSGNDFENISSSSESGSH